MTIFDVLNTNPSSEIEFGAVKVKKRQDFDSDPSHFLGLRVIFIVTDVEPRDLTVDNILGPPLALA